MATEVSSMSRILNGYYFKDDQAAVNETGEQSTAPITHDFLGGSSSSNYSKAHDSQELDLDLEVPNGWEKRLDLKSGKVYIQRSNSPSSSNSNSKTNQTVAKLQDLNFFPTSSVPSPSSSSSSSRVPLNLFDETNLDLKLVPSSTTISSSWCNNNNNNYQSVCTLDKVKFALERAAQNVPKKRSSLSRSSSISNNSSMSSSFKVLNSLEDHEQDYGGDKNSSSDSQQSGALLYAAGCPNCLLYVMISKNNPRCPRCSSSVPLPITKKPRIDLNISM